MRFAHLADTHLGYRQYNLDEREEDFYKAFHEAIDKIIDAECDFVVHSGDLFDDPRPHVRAMVEAMAGFEKLKDAGITVFAIAGNHDVLMRRGAMPPQRLYGSMEFLTPMKPSRVFDGVYICGLPYHSRIHLQALKEKLQELAEAGANYEKKVLLLHQGLDKYFPMEYELKFNELPKGFDYYALGHVHKRIIDSYGRGKLAYPGSTEIWRVDEIAEYEKNGKGLNIVDLDSLAIEKVDIASIRPFISARINSERDIMELKGALSDDKKPVISLKLKADLSEFQRLYRKIFEELRDGVLHLDIKRIDPVEKPEDVSSDKLSLRELFDETMEGHSNVEKEFAYSVYELLSKGNQEGASKLTEEFFEKWKSKGKALEGHD
jgi:DNA repair exonuclease SbcCD nuclease subunit